MNTFGRQSSTVLTTTLRAICGVTGGELEELSYDEYLSQLPESSVSAVLSLEPLPGKALFNLDLTTLLMWVDHMLGGPGTPKQPDRPLTDIEQSLVRHILTRLLRELAYALEPVAVVRPQLLALEGNAQFVQAAAATDPVVVAHLDMQVGDRTSTATLCLPYSMLSPALDAIDDSKQDGERTRLRLEASKLTTRRLADVAVDVAVRFEPLRLPSSRLAELAVGDVLALDHRTTSPLTVVSASTVFAHAVPGASGRRLAVLIVDPDTAPD